MAAASGTLKMDTPTRRGLRNLGLVAVFAFGAWVYSTGLIRAMFDQWDDILYLGKQHLELVGISWGAAVVIGIPLGVLLTRRSVRRMSETILQVVNTGQTIPTLAVLALSMSVLGIGFWPSIFGLWIYSLLPIVRNTYQGILAVPGHLQEAAVGMGMTPRQILWRVELPNALFVMFAGMRTALAINVGTAPLAFLIGGGGLGELIFTGIALDQQNMMLAGAIPVALLAVVLDFVVGLAQFWLVPKGVNPLRGSR